MSDKVPNTRPTSEWSVPNQHGHLNKEQQRIYKAGGASGCEAQRSMRDPAMPQTTTSRFVGTAHNYDEAPPGLSGPDYSARKPVFTRGLSVIDNTAIISAAATPAGEISNPMGMSLVNGGSRQRESHLPDLDLLQAELDSSGTSQIQPKDEISGNDKFGSNVSRAEVDTGPSGTTDNWQD